MSGSLGSDKMSRFCVCVRAWPARTYLLEAIICQSLCGKSYQIAYLNYRTVNNILNFPPPSSDTMDQVLPHLNLQEYHYGTHLASRDLFCVLEPDPAQDAPLNLWRCTAIRDANTVEILSRSVVNHKLFTQAKQYQAYGICLRNLIKRTFAP